MKNGQVQVTGVSKRVKDGRTSFTLYGLTPFESYENENGNESTGLKCISEWTNRVDLSSLHVGDIIELSYAKGYNNTAVLNNVLVVQPTK